MEYDVFLSYSSKDAVTAEILCSALEANGVKCWIAPRDITPGMQWGGAIGEWVIVTTELDGGVGGSDWGDRTPSKVLITIDMAEKTMML